jgi:SAM-dependent methyltransferase
MNSNFIRVVNLPHDRCKVCSADSLLFDVVDFHGNVDLDPNMPQRKTVFPVSGIPIYYWKCSSCGLVYTRALDAFDATDFKEMVYDQSWRDHLLGDARDRANQIADAVMELFRPGAGTSGLDYGGGEGHLSDALNRRGFPFTSYDPFCGSGRKPDRTFDLITCIEVFEHVSDVAALLRDIDQLCADNGGVFFSTALCDGLPRCQGWAYCVPRSGHITFFTQLSLQRAFAGIRLSYRYLGISRGHACHFAWRGRPAFLPSAQ